MLRCDMALRRVCGRLSPVSAITTELDIWPNRRISPAALRRALIAGARRLLADRDLLNRINVFPVPDGDTGNNMAFTAGSILAGALSRRATSVGALLRAVSADALDGARGNSGTILAQFLQGMADAVGDDAPALDARTLVKAVRHGSDSAHAALSEPREGTILSVIRTFAEALSKGHAQGDFAAWLQQALAAAKAALAETPRQLPVLQKAGVVDAGAQGFVDFLDGVVSFMRARHTGSPIRVADLDDLADDEAMAAHHEADAERAHRWCSECLIVGHGIDRAALRAELERLDLSSLVVAGSNERVRVHAHVDAPDVLFATCAHFGRLDACKADDMVAQQQAVKAQTSIAIVTDSSADLPADIPGRLHIHVVPLRINYGDRDYLDKVSLQPREFYALLRSAVVLPRTSQPPPGDFRRQFEFLLAHHPELIYIGLSSAVSGTLQAAEAAAERVDAARCSIFDTRNAAGAQALLAMAAAELALRGAGRNEILRQLEHLRPQALTFALARDVSHAVRGGRIPAWAAPLARWLPLTPIARMRSEGRIAVTGALLGTGSVAARFARYIARRLPQGQRWRAIVGHCDCIDDGVAVRAALERQVDCVQTWLVETGPAVGAHAGPGALVVSLLPEPPANA